MYRRRFANFESSTDETTMDVRSDGSGRMNFGMTFVPEQEVWVVERFGKYDRALVSGLNWLYPILDNVKHVISLKEIAVDIGYQSSITADYCTLEWGGVIFLKVVNVLQASYGVNHPKFAILQLVGTKMKSLIGKLSLERVLGETDQLNAAIVECVNNAASPWGITCLRFEFGVLGGIELPSRVQEAMHEQMVAELRKKACILKSEGVRTAAINVAEGKHQARMLASEAAKKERIDRATAEAEANRITTEAKAKGLQVLADSLISNEGDGADLTNADHCRNALNILAKSRNTVALPSTTGETSSGLEKVLAFYENFSTPAKTSLPTATMPDAPDKNQKQFFGVFSDATDEYL